MTQYQRGYEAAMKGKPAKESTVDFLAGYNEGRRDGISDGRCFFTVKRRKGSLGLHRITSPMLPERTNAAEAQQDLAIYASLKGWTLEG